MTKQQKNINLYNNNTSDITKQIYCKYNINILLILHYDVHQKTPPIIDCTPCTRAPALHSKTSKSSPYKQKCKSCRYPANSKKVIMYDYYNQLHVIDHQIYDVFGKLVLKI